VLPYVPRDRAHEFPRQRRHAGKRPGDGPPRQPAHDAVLWSNGDEITRDEVEADDLLGDSVNVAARLEQLCIPSGIMISGTAYDQLKGKLGLPLDFA